MKSVTRVVLTDDGGEKFFGEGPYRLLKGIQETGSLHGAAMAMEMSYSKALKILKKAEEVIGEPLTRRETGGAYGGGSRLTPTGLEWMQKYVAYREACVKANEELYARFFAEDPDTGCVIMASGTGKRFGGNKLMADFHGVPLIEGCLKATEGIRNRVTVTRHRDVADYCQAQGIRTVVHDLPYRSDTVRLGTEAMAGMKRILFVPADQPLLTRASVERLIRESRKHPDRIARLCYQETDGAPVLFPREFFDELMNLPEGKGGGFLMGKYPERVLRVPAEDPNELRDADTREELAALAEIQ